MASPGANGLKIAIDMECDGKAIRIVQISTFGNNKKLGNKVDAPLNGTFLLSGTLRSDIYISI